MSNLYRKKPVTIRAIQMPYENSIDEVEKVAEWMIENGYESNDYPDDVDPQFLIEYGKVLPEFGVNYLLIETLEGEMMASLGDWIIRGVAGEFYPCRDDIFDETYEAVTDD